jgi:hypothetical protein
MHTRTLYTWLLVGALALGMVATAFYGIVHRPGAARAAGDPIGICIQGTTQCLDDVGYPSTNNGAIRLETVSVPAQQSFLWNLAQIGTVRYANCAPFTYVNPRTGSCDFDHRYNGRPVYKIEKTLPTGGHDGCIGVYQVELAVNPCKASNTDWVLSEDNYFVSVGQTNFYGVLALMSAMTQDGTGTPCVTGNGAFVVVGGTACNLQFSTQG